MNKLKFDNLENMYFYSITNSLFIYPSNVWKIIAIMNHFEIRSVKLTHYNS